MNNRSKIAFLAIFANIGAIIGIYLRTHTIIYGGELEMLAEISVQNTIEGTVPQSIEEMAAGFWTIAVILIFVQFIGLIFTIIGFLTNRHKFIILAIIPTGFTSPYSFFGIIVIVLLIISINRIKAINMKKL